MEDVETQVIPFETTRIPDSAKPVGEEVIVNDGTDGVRIITRVDGQIVSDKTTHPKNKVLYFGTAEITPEPPQEEPEKQPPVVVEPTPNPPTDPKDDDLNQLQGRFDKLVGILKAFVDKLIAIFSKEK